MKKNYAPLICLIVLLFAAYAGKANGDEQSKVNELIEVSTAYRFSDIHKSLTTIDEALAIAQKIDYKQGIARCYLKKGQYLSNAGVLKESGENLEKAAALFKSIDKRNEYAVCLKELADYKRSTGDPEKAEDLIKESTAIATELQDKQLLAECEIASGIIDMKTGEFADATAHLLSALRTAEAIKNDEIIMNSCRELGNINSLEENIPRSNEYFERALNISKKIGNKLGVADAYCNIASNYLTIGDLDNAAVNIAKSMDLSRQLNYKPTLALDLLNMGYCLTYQNKYKEADKQLAEAERVFGELGDKHGQAEVLNAKGYLAAKTHNLDEAEKNYVASATAAQPIKANDQLKASYDGLAYIYEQKKDYEGAYHFQKLSQEISSQVFNTSNARAVTKLQLSYDFEKVKEQQRREQELKDKVTAAERTRERWFNYFLVVVGLMAAIIAVLTYMAYRNSRRAKDLLFEKNILITKEKETAERLLSDIIPAEIETRIKASGITEIENFATVMFIDFDDFTSVEQHFSPIELMDELDLVFKGMDDVCKKFRLETLKTLSDGYLCIGGLANSRDCKPEDVVNAAIKIQLYMEDIRMRHMKEGKAFFQMRIGIHTGQISGGIVGVRTIAADIWGETVQAASGIEKMAAAGGIRISDATFQLVKNKFETIYTGQSKVASREMKVYEITNFKAEYSKLSVSETVTDLIIKLEN